MKVLFLGYNVAKDLSNWLLSRVEELVYTEKRIEINYVKKLKPDFIISYNYHYIVAKEIIDFVGGNIINLHISYLPWNRGSYPNIWSFLEATPKGVSIIYMSEEVDAGDIIVQKEIFFDEDQETLKSSYEKLHQQMQELFKKNWNKIKAKQIKPQKQKGQGNFQYAIEYETIIKPLIKDKGWDISVSELKEKYKFWRISQALKRTKSR